MKKRFVVVFACLVATSIALGACAGPPASSVDISSQLLQCQQLWSQYDLAGAKQTALDILAVDESQPDANYVLAQMTYYYDQDYQTALAYIQQSIEAAPDNPDYADMRGHILLAMHKYDAAAQSYQTVLDLDPTRSETYYNLAQCYLALGRTGDAIAVLEDGHAANPYNKNIAHTLHKLYVHDARYADAYALWQRYSLVVEGEPCIGMIGTWAVQYKNALDEPDNHYLLGCTYEALRLYDEAALEYDRAIDEGQNESEAAAALGEVNAFLRFRDGVSDYLDGYYRNTATAGISAQYDIEHNLMPLYDELAAAVFSDIEITDTFSQLRFNRINQHVEDRFGMLITYFSVDGRRDCYFGTIISKETTHISQWGKEADETVTIVRDMVSNGFNDWYTMHQSGTGGWTVRAGEFVYVFNPQGYMDAYNIAISGKRRTDLLDDNAAISPNPAQKGSLDVYYSPHLSYLFLFKYMDSIIATGQSKGLSGDDLRSFTVTTMLNDYYHAQILSHEGQHALDAQYLHVYAMDEYRQKLSEMAFGNNQFYCLNQFMSPYMGSAGNAHGMADQQILTDMVQYIHDHSADFPTIDIEKNILAQLIDLDARDIQNLAIALFHQQYPTPY